VCFFKKKFGGQTTLNGNDPSAPTSVQHNKIDTEKILFKFRGKKPNQYMYNIRIIFLIDLLQSNDN
jgi:hypothetical protein